MSPIEPESLSRREREILDILYENGELSAADVQSAMDSPPSYSAVRGLLRVLLEKEHVHVEKRERKNFYRPRKERDSAGKSALKRALEIFYGGDLHDAVAALLDVSHGSLEDRDRERLLNMIEKAKEEGV